MSQSILKSVFFLTLLLAINCNAQTATIKEEIISLSTYDFGKANPVPILVENPKIYPYFKFEEYEHTAKDKNWKVITLENDYIKVMVLPEIGGKVWGAIEKSTGEEFLYKNEVVKFRNIAMRGPWTSGGIEFNFGIIGHHPSTATPVDYKIQKNKDGSVSCIVGNTDLPSNTKWTVEIRLEKDKAYFETNASWYNASPLTQSYYNWMTAAAVATDDLEFFIPGNKYVEHNGDAHPWPIDKEGRNLAMYKNNNFGPAKSYHIVGEYNDFFGGYYHDRNFGFGQWAPYEEMPGQKLWLWSQSRSGGIWEDLLTDSDGQYIEFQAGRLFDQYSSGATNPISQVGFDPYVMDNWSEIWFPIKEIGGMEDASKYGVLNVETKNEETYIGINALQSLQTELRIEINGKTTITNIALEPMAVFTKNIATNTSDKIKIYVEGTDLSYSNNNTSNRIKRPFYSDATLKISQSQQLYTEGEEALEYREFEIAHTKLSQLIHLDPSHQEGLLRLAEIEYRKSNYDIAIKHSNAVLRMDTYNASANYIAGISYRAVHDNLNALESLGWAARDIKYRSVAYAQMAEIYIADKKLKRASTYANKALDFNTNNINAREVLLVLQRLIKNKDGFNKERNRIIEIDPLNHFVAMEVARMNNYEDASDTKVFNDIKNEFREETTLAIALRYKQLNFEEEALLTLLSGPRSPKNELWKAYLYKKSNPKESIRILDKLSRLSVNFVFPYRRETIPVLEWAIAQNDSWKLKYYLAQNLMAVGLQSKSMTILSNLKNIPDTSVFYRFRAEMLNKTKTDSTSIYVKSDMKKTLQLSPNDWKVWEENILFNNSIKDFDSAYILSKKAYRKYPENYNIGLAHAKTLLNTQRFNQVLKVFETIQILPFEHASESRSLYERAHLGVALELIQKKNYKKALSILEKGKLWPENIGVGKPYSPDERAMDFYIAMAHKKLGYIEKSNSILNQIITYTNENISINSFNHLYGLLANKKLNNQADKLASRLEIKASTNSKTKWAIAFLKGDTQVLNSIDLKSAVTKDILNTFKMAISL